METDERAERLERDLAVARRREEELTDFLENAAVPLHWVGPDGTIIWANQAELDLLGYTREEYLGRPIAEFHVDPRVIDDILRRLKQKETLRNYEARLRRKDGAIREVLISSNVRWRDDEFVYSRCFTRDITDRKQHEKRLLTQYGLDRILASASSLHAAAPELLRLICEHLQWRAGLFWSFSEEERLLRCEAAWEQAGENHSGFAPKCHHLTFAPGAGLPGRVWSSKAPAWITDLQQDENFPRARVAAEHALRSAFGFPVMLAGRVFGVMEFFSEEIRTPDEEVLKIVASLGYQVGEFLERSRAQQQLADKEESYRVLTETASDGIITIDATGTVLFVNGAAATMFGYTREELAGANVAVLIPEPVRAAQKEALARYIDGGERNHPWQAIPLTGEHRHGYEIPIEVSIGEYRQGNKHVFVGVVRDISERKRLDETLRQTAKLESLGVLAGGIAHDFNNLLTGILGNISLALNTVTDANPARATLHDAIEASERAANLTKQLLAYTGRGRFVIEATDISALIREISPLLRSSIPKHVTVRLDLQQPLPLVEADVAQMQQLIMNMVINGAEAIPADRQGTVLVMTRAQNVDVEYLATLGTDEIKPGSYVAIHVHDNGVGMDEETIAKIFDPFFTTKFTGRGLGLAAAMGIVRGHKGMLRVFSRPGQGTTFKVFLPAGAAVTKKAAAQVSPTDLSGEGTVLVVDDEPIVRKIATTSLERYGYAVITAENGREGVERFRELGAELAIVILDMTMPVMSGEEALRFMRLINPDVPIVLSSGYNEVETIRRFAGKGLAGFIQKPYTAAALAEKVQRVIRESRGTRAS